MEKQVLTEKDWDEDQKELFRILNKQYNSFLLIGLRKEDRVVGCCVNGKASEIGGCIDSVIDNFPEIGDTIKAAVEMNRLSKEAKKK